MAIRSIDLNLFRIFQSLLKHRSVVASARELGVTPSAVSHALTRLRRAVGNDLFVAGATGMEPTPFALRIAPSVEAGVGFLTSVSENGGFDPLTTTRTFTIGASEYTTTRFIAPLVRALAHEAPLATLRVVPAGRLDLIRSLDEGRSDLVLGWFGDMAPRLHRRRIATEHEALLVRSGHPLAAEPQLSTQAILEYPFLVVELTGSEEKALNGFVEERQAQRRTWIECLLVDTERQEGGVVGRVAATVPYYGSVGPILLGTDMVATMPRTMAERLQAQDELVVLKLPYAPAEIAVEAVWHQRNRDDQGLRWLLDRLGPG